MQLFFIRHCVGRDEVPAAHFGPVEGQFLRNPIQKAFHREGGLGMSGAPDGRRRYLVGERHLHIHAACRHHIAHGKGLRRIGGEVDTTTGISAVIVDDLATDAEELAVFVTGDLDLPILVPFLGSGDEMLPSILDPFYRPSEEHRRYAKGHVLGIEDELRSKPAADIGCGDAGIALVAPQHIDQGPLRCVRRLGRAPISELIGCRVVFGDATSAFHRMSATSMLP